MMIRRVHRMFPEVGGIGGTALLPEVSRLVDSVFAGLPEGVAGVTPVFPPINAFEDAEAIHLEAELPGYALSDVSITMEGPELTIAGSRSETLPEGATPIRRERSAGVNFSRTIRLGVPVDAERVTAKLESGVLSVTLPKAEAARARKIEVKGG